MKRHMLVWAILPVLVFALAGVAQAWQERMGGMGDPYGLLQDESDFLIHPAKIAKGEGIRYYGDYRFTYTGVTDWELDRDFFSPTGILTGWAETSVPGDVYENDALLGASSPVGPGRLGIFFNYSGMRGNNDGDYFSSPATYGTVELTSTLDDFALRLLYGLPVGGLNLGGEVQIAYRGEENEVLVLDPVGTGNLNSPSSSFCFFPYDSSYWEALFKGSLEGMAGPLDLELTLRGGFIFAGDNDWTYEQYTAGIIAGGWDLDGGVNGWRIGGDLWVRYPVDSVTLPFLVRIDYQEKTRDGDGGGMLGLSTYNFDYQEQEKRLDIEAGGGVEKELNAGTRIAGGIYYHYLQRKDTFSYYYTWPLVGGATAWQNFDYTCPDCTEHQAIVRLAGEHEISPSIALRAGVNGFFGWLRRDWEQSILNYAPAVIEATYPRNGLHWGIGASLGASMRFAHLAFEPFIAAGYQGFDLSGDGDSYINGVLQTVIDVDESRSQWYISGGSSFLFDLP